MKRPAYLLNQQKVAKEALRIPYEDAEVQARKVIDYHINALERIKAASRQKSRSSFMLENSDLHREIEEVRRENAVARNLGNKLCKELKDAEERIERLQETNREILKSMNKVEQQNEMLIDAICRSIK